MNVCTGCREDFASVAAFDAHRRGVHAYTYREALEMGGREDGRRCLDAAEMREAGMELDPRGRWRMALTEQRKRSLEALRSQNTSSGSAFQTKSGPGYGFAVGRAGSEVVDEEDSDGGFSEAA